MKTSHACCRRLLSPAKFGAVSLSLAALLLLLPMLMQLIRHRYSSSSTVSGIRPASPKFVVHLTVEKRIKLQLQRYSSGLLADIGQHVFSAYFDTREALGGRKFVRIITVLDTRAYSGRFLCQMLDEFGELSYATAAKSSPIGKGLPYKTHYYREFILSCPIANNDTRSAAYVVLQTEDAALRSRVLPVRHNPLSLGEQSDPELIINCVSVTFGSPNEYQLIEWLEAQRLLKMDKVQLHFYHLRSRDFEAVAQAYTADGLLEVRRIECPFCVPGLEEWLGLLLMSPAINQCFYENLGRYKYTAVFDLDEIIVPQRHPDYPSLLEALEKQANTNSFAFPNWYHFFELGENASVPAEMRMLRHPYRVKQVSPQAYSTKSIHKSCCVVALHNHFTWENAPKSRAKMMYQHISADLGVNEHYKKCHLNCKAVAKSSERVDGLRLTKLMGRELTNAFRSKVRQIFGKSL